MLGTALARLGRGSHRRTSVEFGWVSAIVRSPPMFNFGDDGRMLDTDAVARSWTDAEFTPTQADAITNALRLAVEHGDLDRPAVARSLTDAESPRPRRTRSRTRSVLRSSTGDPLGGPKLCDDPLNVSWQPLSSCS